MCNCKLTNNNRFTRRCSVPCVTKKGNLCTVKWIGITGKQTSRVPVRPSIERREAAASWSERRSASTVWRCCSTFSTRGSREPFREPRTRSLSLWKLQITCDIAGSKWQRNVALFPETYSHKLGLLQSLYMKLVHAGQLMAMNWMLTYSENGSNQRSGAPDHSPSSAWYRLILSNTIQKRLLLTWIQVIINLPYWLNP